VSACVRACVREGPYTMYIIDSCCVLYFTSNERRTVQIPDTRLHHTNISEGGGYNPKTMKFLFAASQHVNVCLVFAQFYAHCW
jgi:hypothetical protein